MCDIIFMNCSKFVNISVYCINVLMYAYINVLLSVDMYEIKILLLLLIEHYAIQYFCILLTLDAAPTYWGHFLFCFVLFLL